MLHVNDSPSRELFSPFPCFISRESKGDDRKGQEKRREQHWGFESPACASRDIV